MDNKAQMGQNNQQFMHRSEQQTEKIRQEAHNSTSAKKEFTFSFEKQNEIEKELRKPRSTAYMEVISAVDMLSADDEEIIGKLKESMDEDTAEDFSQMTDEELLEEIRQSFLEEFSSIGTGLKDILIGVLSRCYIGGCDCHAISPEGKVMEHFRDNMPLPNGLQKGRALLKKYPDCKCVEVYTDCCRVISSDSTVTKISDNERK